MKPYSIHTDFVYPPIPIRSMDWQAIYDDYDGAEDSGNRHHVGYGCTEAEAVVDLIVKYPRGVECGQKD